MCFIKTQKKQNQPGLVVFSQKDFEVLMRDTVLDQQPEKHGAVPTQISTRARSRLSWVADAVVASEHGSRAGPGSEFSGTRARGVAVGPFAPLLPLTVNPCINRSDLGLR